MIPNSDRPAAPPTASATRAVALDLALNLALGLAVGAALCVSLLAGCATTPPLAADGWQQQTLPGKPNTQYRWTQKEGRTALQADSQQSASLWRKRLDPAEPAPQQVRFS